MLDQYLAALRTRLPQRAATLQFLEVLELVRAYPLQEVVEAVARALAAGSLGAETVSYLLRHRGRQCWREAPLS